jgi:NMD protein affecting ribosome stability and mRNA decay
MVRAHGSADAIESFLGIFMTNPSKPSDTNALHQGRQDRLLQELEHDPYKSKRKLPEPTVCPECGAIYHKGRWQWASTPEGAHEEMCPACQRIRDRVPQGILTLSGEFVGTHTEEIMNVIHNLEEKEKAQHPLKRIMASEEQPEGLEVTFTDAHLARGAGEALHHAYKGELDFQYTDEENMLRVTWHR